VRKCKQFFSLVSLSVLIDLWLLVLLLFGVKRGLELLYSFGKGGLEGVAVVWVSNACPLHWLLHLARKK
jgi:hypothetical protein